MAKEFCNHQIEHPFPLHMVHDTMDLPDWVDAVVLRSQNTVFIYTNARHPAEKQAAVVERERMFVAAHPNGPGVRCAVLESTELASSEKWPTSRVGAILVQSERHDRVPSSTE